MQSELLGALRSRELEIRIRWAALLRAEPVRSPLGHPEALTHLIDWTLAQIFRTLATGEFRDPAVRNRSHPSYRSLCACGRNPLLAYFDSAGQALREALVLVQAATPLLDPIERDASLDELNQVLGKIAWMEVEAFCGVCQHRHEARDCAQCPSLSAAEASS